VCPTCGKPMEVPRLSATGASHPATYLVAAIPTPKQRFSSRIPTIDLWTEKEWDERYRAVTTPSEQAPAWLVVGIGTIIVAAWLKAASAPSWTVILCMAAGTAFSAYLLVRRQTVAAYGTIAKVVLGIVLLILAIPAVAVGILFIGCACR
jgi:hypothetical protein